jgi:hypothetical protein
VTVTSALTREEIRRRDAASDAQPA